MHTDFATSACCHTWSLPNKGSISMFHISAFFASLAAQTNGNLAALSDDIIPVSNNHLLPYRDYQLIKAYAGSATMTRARLNSGTIRQVNPTYIRPINGAVLPG